MLPSIDFNPDTRGAILALQSSLKAEITAGNLEDKLAECSWRHFFIPGGYAREMTIPAGLLVIGKIHRFPCVNIVSRGHVVVFTENGRQEIVAPYTFVSDPGIKRVAVALTETVWTTFHVTDETDLDKIEATLVADTYEDLALPGTAAGALT